MRRSLAVLLALGFSASGGLAVSCSTIDLDGLTGGLGDHDGASDVGLDAVERADGADGGSPADQSAGDAGSHDAQPPDGSTWCDLLSPHPSFCADFDRGPLAINWDFFNHDNGEGGLDDAAFISPPSSFVATSIDATDAGPGFDIVLAKAFASPLAEARYAFDLQFDPVPSATGAKVAAIELSVAGTTTYGVGFVLLPSGAEVEQYAPANPTKYTYVPLTSSPQPGVWARIQMILIVTAPDGGAILQTITVTVDGAVVLDHYALTTPNAAGVPTISIGLVYGQLPSPPWRVRVDDVTFDMVKAP